MSEFKNVSVPIEGGRLETLEGFAALNGISPEDAIGQAISLWNAFARNDLFGEDIIVTIGKSASRSWWQRPIWKLARLRLAKGKSPHRWCLRLANPCETLFEITIESNDPEAMIDDVLQRIHEENQD